MTELAQVSAPAASEKDLRFAQVLVRVHCAIEWPEGVRCLNCHSAHPCQFHEWANATLTGAGWTPEQIKALDERTGPWS